MFAMAMFFAELFNSILFWCVYQDVANLPYFSLAQFMGIIFMINIGMAIFRSETVYIYYDEHIKQADKLKYKIGSMFACILLTSFYYFCKIFM
ncbi:MAG: hypothetical protein Q4A69_09565 [Moraxella sp.]|nr:hypothetical protein [Moraxella sp.]